MDLIYQGATYERDFRSIDGSEIEDSSVFLYNRIRKKAFKIPEENIEVLEDVDGKYHTHFYVSSEFTAIMPVGVYDLQIVTPKDSDNFTVRYYERNFAKVVASALSLDTTVKP